MPRERFQNLPARERERLLGIALRHFARSGFERASLNEILAEAGLSKGSYYYYFDDKADLLATVLESTFERVFASAPRIDPRRIDAKTYWREVDRLLDAWVEFFADADVDVVKATMIVDEELRRSPRFEAVLAKAARMYRELIEIGQRVGCVRDDLPIEVMVRLLEATDGVLDAALAARGTDIDRAVVKAHGRLVLDTFRRLLERKPEARRPRARR